VFFFFFLNQVIKNFMVKFFGKTFSISFSLVLYFPRREQIIHLIVENSQQENS